MIRTGAREGGRTAEREGAGGRRLRERAGPEPWWLSDDASCPFCGQAHAAGMEYRCLVCDGVVCALCAVEVEVHRRAVCPECEHERP